MFLFDLLCCICKILKSALIDDEVFDNQNQCHSSYGGYEPNFMAIPPMVVGIFQCRPKRLTDQPTNIAMPRAIPYSKETLMA